MNGQPPPVPPPQPPPSPPPPPSAPVPPRQVPLAPQGMGCFAKGCLTVLVAGFIFLAGVMALSWYLYVKTVRNLTSPIPADIQIAPPSETQFQTAENSKARLKEAIANNKETTVEFTAPDLNALFARDPDFEDWRGHIRIEIADSI